jgi:nucleotide-binding universal stress UspA family protein
MFKHILLATDGSAASRHAARMAAQLAHEHAARLTALFVVDPYPYLGIGQVNPLGFQAYMAHAQEHAAQAHAEIDALCRQEDRQVNLQVRMAEDVTPASGIVQTARELQVDLIVIGSHGRSGLSRLMLGSVANQVVARSPVPVLVVRRFSAAPARSRCDAEKAA